MAITDALNIAALSGGLVAIVVVLILLVAIFLLVTITKKRKSKGNLRAYFDCMHRFQLIFGSANFNGELSGNEVPVVPVGPVYEEVGLAMTPRIAAAGPVYEEVGLAMTPRTQDIQVESNEAYGQVRK